MNQNDLNQLEQIFNQHLPVQELRSFIFNMYPGDCYRLGQDYFIQDYYNFMKNPDLDFSLITNQEIIEFNKQLVKFVHFMNKNIYGYNSEVYRLDQYEFDTAETFEQIGLLDKEKKNFIKKYEKLLKYYLENKDGNKSELNFKVRCFKEDNIHYFRINNLDPIKINRGDYRFISHFENSLSEVTRKDLGLEGKKYDNSLTSSMGRLNGKLESINYKIKNIGHRGDSIYKIIKL